MLHLDRHFEERLSPDCPMIRQVKTTRATVTIDSRDLRILDFGQSLNDSLPLSAAQEVSLGWSGQPFGAFSDGYGPAGE